MAQRSLPWTAGAGDGHAYTPDEWRLLHRILAGNPSSGQGVAVGQLNQLAVTSTGNNNIRVASGRALVDATVFENDAEEVLVVASPTVGTTGKRVVLRKSWSARTVRIAVISSADGTAAIPALTQTDGATWESPLASFTITTGGVIGALTDQREYVPFTAAGRVTSAGVLSADAVGIASVSKTSTGVYSVTFVGPVIAVTASTDNSAQSYAVTTQRVSSTVYAIRTTNSGALFDIAFQIIARS